MCLQREHGISPTRIVFVCTASSLLLGCLLAFIFIGDWVESQSFFGLTFSCVSRVAKGFGVFATDGTVQSLVNSALVVGECRRFFLFLSVICFVHLSPFRIRVFK